MMLLSAIVVFNSAVLFGGAFAIFTKTIHIQVDKDRPAIFSNPQYPNFDSQWWGLTYKIVAPESATLKMKCEDDFQISCG